MNAANRSFRGWIGACLAVALLGGCSGVFVYQLRPDLAALYDRPAQYHGPERNPVIVIPGLMGSRLVDAATDRIVWGMFSGDYARPDRPADARLIALPMREGVPLGELTDSVYADRVLDRVRVRLLGVPIQVQAYLDILAALGVGGYRDESLGLGGAVDYGEDHFTCFQFPFDFRRDNVENARRLHEFIEEKAAYVSGEIARRTGGEAPEVRFDVVAHSMGALLLRYYLRYGAADLPADGSLPELTWDGARRIERAVMVGPPNAGAAETVQRLVEGQKPGPFLARYPPAVLGTFPASYQLLPRTRHRPLMIDGQPQEPIADLFEPALWERLGWGLAAPDQEPVLAWLLPDIADAAERRRVARDHLRKSLERARRFHEALDRPAPLPSGLQLFLIAGDAKETPLRLAADPETGALRILETAAGDGKVLGSSALMDERMDGEWAPALRTPIGWSAVHFLFTDHLGLTRDPAFTDNVLYWLLDAPRPAAAVSRSNGLRPPPASPVPSR